MNAKCMVFIACCSIMSAVVYGMEPEKSISQDSIFVWTSEDRQYHAVTELGKVSEDNILQKNDQPHKIYRAQLVVKKNEEGEESNKLFLRTTQELVSYYTGCKFINLNKQQRTLIPISFSQAQRKTMWHRYSYCWDNQKESVLAMDNESNVYFITHVYDENRDNSKKVDVYNTKEFQHQQVPLLSKKRMLLKIDTLEKEVAQLKKSMGASQVKIPTITAEHNQESLSQRNRFKGKVIVGSVIFAPIFVFLLYAYTKNA